MGHRDMVETRQDGIDAGYRTKREVEAEATIVGS